MADNEKENYEIISLTFFKDWHELATKYNLTDDEYGSFVRAMCDYCFYDKDTDLPLPAGMIFEMSKPYIKASNKRKISGHSGGSKGGGGAPKENKNASKKKE
jgi:hypothetical protein